MTSQPQKAPRDLSPLAKVVAASRSAFTGVGAFSFVINLLMLTGPLFMAHIYPENIGAGTVQGLYGGFI